MVADEAADKEELGLILEWYLPISVDRMGGGPFRVGVKGFVGGMGDKLFWKP
jgi:hypothetical protein